MKLNLGCGDDIRDDWINVDIAETVSPDVVLDIGVDSWPWDKNTVESIHAYHVLEHLNPKQLIHAMSEASRVLQPDKYLTARVPLGVNAFTDPSHQTFWTIDTPVHFTSTGGEYLNPLAKLPFRLVDRRITDAIGHGPAMPLGPIARQLFKVWKPASPWLSTTPFMSFELEFVLGRNHV